jgi:hypothetical protein
MKGYAAGRNSTSLKFSTGLDFQYITMNTASFRLENKQNLSMGPQVRLAKK